MYHDVVEMKCLDDFKLSLTFDDGKTGVLDCKPFIAKGGGICEVDGSQRV